MSRALTPAEFEQQVQALFEQHGAAAFAAPMGQLPSYTLFVDGEQVVAEAQASPRHRYGAFCELTQPVATGALAPHVQQWLQTGEAYALYLSMNVCRYSC